MELYYRLEYHHGPNDEAHEYLVIGKTTRNVSGEERERGYETDIKETEAYQSISPRFISLMGV
jgi:hypothetical protein